MNLVKVEFLYNLLDSRHRGRTIACWDSAFVPREKETVWLGEDGGTKSIYTVKQVSWQGPDHVKCVVEES